MAKKKGNDTPPAALALAPTTLAKVGVTGRLPSGWVARDESKGFIDLVPPEQNMSLFLGCARVRPEDSIAAMLGRFTAGAPTRVERGWTLADGTANDGKLRTVVCMRDDGERRVWVRLTGTAALFANNPHPDATLLEIALSLEGMQPSG